MCFTVLSNLVTNILVNGTARCCASSDCGPAGGLTTADRANATAVVVNNLSMNVLSALVPVIVVTVYILATFCISNNGRDTTGKLCNVTVSTINVLSALNVALTASTCNPITSGTNNVTRVTNLRRRMHRHASTLSSLNGAATTANGNFTVNSTTLATLTLVMSCVSGIRSVSDDVSGLGSLTVAGPAILVNLFVNTYLPFMFTTVAVGSINHTTRDIMGRIHHRFGRVGNLVSNGTRTSCTSYISLYAGTDLRRVVLPAVITIIMPVVIKVALN